MYNSVGVVFNREKKLCCLKTHVLVKGVHAATKQKKLKKDDNEGQSAHKMQTGHSTFFVFMLCKNVEPTLLNLVSFLPRRHFSFSKHVSFLQTLVPVSPNGPRWFFVGI